MNRDATLCFFVSDLHGVIRRYEQLFQRVRECRPSAVFIGGDLLCHSDEPDFLRSWLIPRLLSLQQELESAYPKIYVILGNDDPRCLESVVLEAARFGLWTYLHGRKAAFSHFAVYGYSCVPPTPFRLKDWERYDVSRFSDPGCVSPEEGVHTVAVDESELKWGTIKADLGNLVGTDSLEHAVMLFHSPPYDTALDRAALDGRQVDHVPLDVHVGSIAVRRFIDSRQPFLTLHGHVHESPRLTGKWKIKLGDTICLSAAHDGPELALVRFDICAPETATRELL